MKLILKCTSHEFSPDDIEWAFVTLDAPLLERSTARRRISLQSQAQDTCLLEMFFWDNTTDFFALSPDPDTDPPKDENESLEAVLRNHTGQPIEWAEDLHRVSEATTIPDAYLRAVECAPMRVDENGIAWVCHPKHIDAEVRTGTTSWELIKEQRLFAPQPDDR
jgi:hypothetical protein